MSAIETPKKILTSEACFLCKAEVSSKEKIKARFLHVTSSDLQGKM